MFDSGVVASLKQSLSVRRFGVVIRTMQYAKFYESFHWSLFMIYWRADAQMRSLLTFTPLCCINKIDSMLPCVGSVIETFRSDYDYDYEYEIYHLYLRAHARNVTE